MAEKKIETRKEVPGIPVVAPVVSKAPVKEEPKTVHPGKCPTCGRDR